MAETRAQANRKVRQEAMREQLAEQCRLQHVIEAINKIADLDSELDSDKVNRLKIANEQRLKLLNKYLPDLKAIEHSGDSDNPLYGLFQQISGNSVGLPKPPDE